MYGGHGARSVDRRVRLAAVPCVANCDGMKRKSNTCFETFRLADFWKQAIRTRLDRFLREKNALTFGRLTDF